MNNFGRGAVAVMLAATLVISMIAGCSKDAGDAGGALGGGGGLGSGSGGGQDGGQGNSGGGYTSSVNGEIVYHDPSDTVYVADIVSFPEETGIVPVISYGNDRLYFVSTVQWVGGEEDFYAHRSDDGLYSMNLDGSGFTKLEHYVPPAVRADGDFGSFSIDGVSVDVDGNLWVAERWEFYGYDLPSGFDSVNSSPWEYQRSRSSGSAIRKLDLDGTELLSVDVGELAGGQDGLHIVSFAANSDGYIYLNAMNTGTGALNIYVLGSDGSLRFSLPLTDYVYRLVTMADGSVAFPTGSSGSLDRMLQTIDADAKCLGEAFPLPDIGGDILPGGGNFDVLISPGNDLFGYTVGGEAVHLVNWAQCGVLSDYVQNLPMLPDERIICTNYRFNRAAQAAKYELIVLSKTTYAELPQKTTLTLATIGLYGDLEIAIADFNRTHPEITVFVNDYLEYGSTVLTPADPAQMAQIYARSRDRYNTALTRLATDIITGNAPDILAVSELPFGEYAARGLFADLYPFIDADSEYSRGDFVDGAFRASEIDGRLYQVFPSFSVETLVGRPSVVGSGGREHAIGWTVDEFKAMLEAHPEAKRPLGQYVTDLGFLEAAVSLGGSGFIDWGGGDRGSGGGGGKVFFDSPDFVSLLEICKTLPRDERNEGGRLFSSEEYVPEEESIASGDQLMRQMSLYGFDEIAYYKAIFGGELAYKGYPAADASGAANGSGGGSGVSLTADCALAIIENSPNKDAAWAFVRTILDKNWQLGNCWSLPTNKAAFDARVSDALAGNFTYVMGYVGLDVKPIIQEDINQVVSLISSADGAGQSLDRTIWEIISEEASDFFAGGCTAADAARVIQSRVAIVVSERS